MTRLPLASCATIIAFILVVDVEAASMAIFCSSAVPPSCFAGLFVQHSLSRLRGGAVSGLRERQRRHLQQQMASAASAVG